MEKMENKNYLFIFTITPVQSFISQARKTRDLYAGSQILSELTKQAIKETLRYDAEIIMPYVKESDLENISSIPNRFVAKFTNIDEENLEIIGRNIEYKTILFWKKEIAQNTLETIEKKFNVKVKEKCKIKFNDHITKYFNIYWLFYPIDNRQYIDIYKEAERYLGAVKNVRCFEQFDTEENHRKCSICGERDAIVYKNIKFKEKGKTEPAYAYINSLLLAKTNLIQENEGLCGVCFVKRFYGYKGEKNEFPSTIKIAFLNLFNDECTAKMVKEYKSDILP